MLAVPIFAVAYLMRVIALPAGWSLPDREDYSPQVSSRVQYAALGANGSVAVILSQWSGKYSVQGCGTAHPPAGIDCDTKRSQDPAQRILIVRANGTTTTLYARTAVLVGDGPHASSECTQQDCPFFSNVALANDGTPFVTLSEYFSGAYSGLDETALFWNGSWHRASIRRALRGLGKPNDPTNTAVAAADLPDAFAVVGDYRNGFATEDLDVARNDPLYMADVSGARFSWGAVGLGVGDAMAMRGRFVAGFASRTTATYPQYTLASALRWECEPNQPPGHACMQVTLGRGVAYGVDWRGDVVGSDGSPVLWRDGKTEDLDNFIGAAYAIGEDGTIVGTIIGSSGFIANACDARPRAIALDPLVRNLGARHITAALGIADDGRILALVTNDSDLPGAKGQLAVLTPV